MISDMRNIADDVACLTGAIINVYSKNRTTQRRNAMFAVN